jgi:hypothetical protein
MLRYSSLKPLRRDRAPLRADLPSRNVAACSDERKVALARHTLILAAAARGELSESDPSVVAAHEFFAAQFGAPEPQAARQAPGPVPSMATWSDDQKKALANRISELASQLRPDICLPPLPEHEK